MKARDNVIPIDTASKRESSDQPSSTIKRVMARTKRIATMVVIVLIVFVLGAVILLKGDNLVTITLWLERSENGLVFWRLALYTGAVIYGYKWLLTPDQQANRLSIKKTRILIAGVAIAFEVLLVQKGLAGLAQLIHGGL